MILTIILCILLLTLISFCYFVFNRNILSPTFICSVMYFLSTVLLILYYKTWNMSMSPTTVIVIWLSLIFMLMGEFCAENRVHVSHRLMSAVTRYDSFGKEIILSNSLQWICFLFISVTAVLYYQEVVKVVANSAYAHSQYGQVYSFFMQAYWARYLEDANIAYPVQQMFTASSVLASYMIYVFIYNKIVVKRKKFDFLQIASAVVYVITTLLFGGRSNMLNFFIYIIFTIMLVSAKNNNWHFTSNFKTLMKVLGIAVATAIGFYYAGYLTGKATHYNNFFDNIANYFSSSIYGFNEYIKSPSKFVNYGDSGFGVYTLSGLYSFLRNFFSKLPNNIVSLEFIQCGNYLTNIYTPLRRYIQDFGYMGNFIIMFFLGYFYKRLIGLSRDKNSSHFQIIVAATFIFPLFFMSVEERFFMNIVTIRSVYVLIYMFIFYRFFFASLSTQAK